ncbi:MAG: Rid family detoxifying hydrolase [Flavobacteriaceae bacterium]|nr:Rid family detoxifying hydrolase [Flavobacteriaceae bacterium]
MKNILKLILSLFIIINTSCTTHHKTEIEFLKSKEEKKKELPFSDAVKVGDILFLAGQIGMDHSVRKLVDGGIKAETTQVLENIKAVLEANGSDLNHVVKCTVILADINDFAAMNEVYKTYFKDNFPARTTFAANLVAGAKIEIEAVAVIE